MGNRCGGSNPAMPAALLLLRRGAPMPLPCASPGFSCGGAKLHALLPGQQPLQWFEGHPARMGCADESWTAVCTAAICGQRQRAHGAHGVKHMPLQRPPAAPPRERTGFVGAACLSKGLEVLGPWHPATPWSQRAVRLRQQGPCSPAPCTPHRPHPVHQTWLASSRLAGAGECSGGGGVVERAPFGSPRTGRPGRARCRPLLAQSSTANAPFARAACPRVWGLGVDQIVATPRNAQTACPRPPSPLLG